MASLARAQQEGDFIYTSEAGAITITSYTGTDEDVTIPATIAGLPVRIIGFNAFISKSELVSVIIPDGVTVIDHSAFSYCTSLAIVTISDSVTAIGNGAFTGCTSLVSVVIPKGVASIGTGAFSACSNLSHIEVAEGNAAYRSESGVLFNFERTTLVQYPAGKAGSHYVIPDSVTTVGGGAFVGCWMLASVVIAESVTFIGHGAFARCENLGSMIIPDSVTFLGISVFRDCPRLARVTMGGNVSSIKGDTFANCSNLESITISHSVVSIGAFAFINCRSLASITIPGNVARIGNGAFAGCTSLASVTFEGNAPTIANHFNLFVRTVPGLMIYYHAGASGFASPLWLGYPAMALGAVAVPALENWRKEHFGEEAANSGDAADDADPDGDGQANVQEYMAGTYPKNAGSRLQVASIIWLGNTCEVVLEAQPGRRYDLLRCPPPLAWGGKSWPPTRRPPRLGLLS